MTCHSDLFGSPIVNRLPAASRVDPATVMRIEDLARGARLSVVKVCLLVSGRRTEVATGLSKDEAKLAIAKLCRALSQRISGNQQTLQHCCPMCENDKPILADVCEECEGKIEGQRGGS